VYVVLGGNGRVKLDDEVFDVDALDAVRVSPEVARAFEAGPDGLELIAFGPHHDADGEPVEDSWVE
jgi:quercetin dioxygenase-like cupin family protein